MRLINETGIDAVHHDGETHTADDAGVFDLPDEVGHHLLAFEGWQHVEDDTDEDDTDDQADDDTDEAPRPRRRRAAPAK